MIPIEEKQGRPYLAVKKLYTFLRGTTSKHHFNFFCLNYLHTFRTENKLNFHEKVCKNKNFCGIAMPSERDNMLEFNQYMRSDKIIYIIYAESESLIKKQMDLHIIEKILQQQKLESTFLVDIQSQQFGHLIPQTANILHIAKKIV